MAMKLDPLLVATIIRLPHRKIEIILPIRGYRDFGKGSGHPAKLNLGDCFAYALAKQSGEPLLFKGNDFAHTDVVPVLKGL